MLIDEQKEEDYRQVERGRKNKEREKEIKRKLPS